MKKVIMLIAICLLCSCGEKELVCDRGLLSGEDCIVYVTQDIRKSCKPGFEYEEETNRCVSRMTIDAKPKFICNKGYYQGDGKCISNEIFAQKLDRYCVSDRIADDDELSTTEERNSECWEKICIEVNEDGTCKKFEENKIDYKVQWGCPDGSKKIDGECRKISYQGKSYSCELGTLDGKKCIIESTSDVVLGCSEGYTLNEADGICDKTIYEKAYLK